MNMIHGSFFSQSRLCFGLCLLVFFVGVLPVAAMEPAWTYQAEEQVQTIAISTNATLIAAGGDGKGLYVLDGNGALLWEKSLESPILNVAVTVDGSSVTAFNDRGKIYCFNRSGGELWSYQTNVGTFSGKSTSFYQTPDGSFTVTGNEYGMVYKVNKSGQLVWETFLGRKIHDLAMTGDGNWTLTGEDGGRSELLDSGGNITWTTDGFANHVVMTRDGGIFVIGGGEASLGECAIYRDEMRAAFRKMGNANDLAITPRGTVTVIASEDGNLYRYDREGRSVWNFSFDGKPMQKVAMPSDASWIAAISGDSNMILVKNDGSLAGSLFTKSPLLDLAFTPDGSAFVAASRNRNIYLFRVPLTGQALVPLVTASASPLVSMSAITTTPAGNSSGAVITQTANATRARTTVQTPRMTASLPTTAAPATPTTTPTAGSFAVPLLVAAGCACAYVIRRRV